MKENTNQFKGWPPKKKPSVPEGYFDQLESEILDKVSIDEGNKKRRVIQQLWPVAASVAVAFIAFAFWMTINPVEKSNSLAEISEHEIIQYLSEEELEFSDDDLQNGLALDAFSIEDDLIIDELLLDDIELLNETI